MEKIRRMWLNYAEGTHPPRVPTLAKPPKPLICLQFQHFLSTLLPDLSTLLPDLSTLLPDLSTLLPNFSPLLPSSGN